MAGRVSSAFRYSAIVLHLTLLTSLNNGLRYGDKATTLHIVEDDHPFKGRQPVVINRDEHLHDDDASETSSSRSRRDVPPEHPANDPHIVTKVNALNDSHQQLMVHWVGDGSNVIICLARDNLQILRHQGSKFTNVPIPSAVYISYDYGDTFINKTEHFRVSSEPNAEYATLDKFMNHPKYYIYCIFVDSANKLLFLTPNNGEIIQRVALPFNPSEISFSETDPRALLALDKKDPERKLWLSMNMGITWVPICLYVKAFFWSSSPVVVIERMSPSGSNTVLELPWTHIIDRLLKVGPDKGSLNESLTVVMTNVEDFQMKGDYRFATSKDTKSEHENLDLYVSYKNNSFVKAEFSTDLPRKNYHIVDVSYNRIFVTVAHNETQVNLYVSEIIDEKRATFVLSLEGIMTFFPNSTWKDSWLNDVADDTFTDLYKVEGLRGIYIVSQVKGTPKSGTIGPEHLVSLITFDHGSTWNPISTPTANHEGFYIHCMKNCSLHLSQRFSQLYPVTRSVSIMSSKSAPGIIMATGVIGSSLKGHPALYVSRDAGITWKQVLKDYYFFNMGDHGGLLVAVKYFKSRGETRDLSYSIDEGENWQTYTFNEKMLRVYGLMTEPGENTTVFTMFGSDSGQHQWLIIKVDLRNVFAKNCTDEDFKFWYPLHWDQSEISCWLGRKEIYRRRATWANCYTGVDYTRPIRTVLCQCESNDYQCDFGFMREGNPSMCIRNKSMFWYDPYAIPSTCKPGEFYNRTKGYVKISDDECVGGSARNFEPDEIPCPIGEVSQFLLVAQREHISRIDLAEENLEKLPVHDLKNVIAIDFDMKNNCLYWADIVNDTIGRQCFNGTNAPEILVETDLSSIEGMAFDWVSNLLYFVDGVKMRIQVIRTDISNMGRMRRTILGPNNLRKPRGIAVHPMNGYMFWTDWAPDNASVSRANLDGTEVKRLFVEPTVEWPNGITIDHIAERIYWVDAQQDYIGSSDFDGKKFKKVISNNERVSHPFAVAVFKDSMYWDDWKQSMIFVADKDHGLGIYAIIGELTGLMDLKVFAHSIQQGTNACANSTCPYICVGAPKNGYSCLCPDGMEMVDGKCMCPEGVTPNPNFTCPRVASTCAANQFTCNNDVCIPEFWHCDGDNDCGDRSDELNCPRKSCFPNFECDNNTKCISPAWVCDIDKDCRDGTDEMNCKYSTCPENLFKCDGGRCIVQRWVCDGEYDCQDFSDELFCKTEPGDVARNNTCRSDEMLCKHERTCIPTGWKCDGEVDCEDGMDETDCSRIVCENWQFTCNLFQGNRRCIYKSFVCDGDKDCPDGSDEVDCGNSSRTPATVVPVNPALPTSPCNDWMFMCANKKCVPYWWKCDSVDDCGDDSDEFGCGNPEDTDTTTAIVDVTVQPKVCKENRFQCMNGFCIPNAWVCDGTNDCPSGEDELRCVGDKGKCNEGQFKCRISGGCIPIAAVCNGEIDCPDETDELGCSSEQHSTPATPSCHPGLFPCDEVNCFPLASFCDGNPECLDGFDENNCDKNNSRVYQVLVMGIDERSTNATSLFLFWLIPVPANVTFEFLPSIAYADPPGNWTNSTKWIEEMDYQFNELKPYTRYNVTVYVRVKGQSTVFPPAKYLIVMTGKGVPSEPRNLTVKQGNGTRVELHWLPPLHPNGPIIGYEGFMTPPNPPVRFFKVKSPAVIDLMFEDGKNYSFWVIARNGEYESASSNVATLTFDGSVNIDYIEKLLIFATTNHSVELGWKPIKNVDEYQVKPRASYGLSYPKLPMITTTQHRIEVKNLSPGVRYFFEVKAVRKNYFGRTSTISATTQGTQLPVVRNLTAHWVKQQDAPITLSWQPPEPEKKIKWQYAIHYSNIFATVFDERKLLTTNLTVTIENLEACKQYWFAVGVNGEYGVGPLCPPIGVFTSFNARAPPKRPRVLKSDRDDTIIIAWTASCYDIYEPIKYTITVIEMTRNKNFVVTLPPTNETIMKHTFSSIRHGGKYCIVIATDVENAEPSQPIFYNAPEISPPHQLQVISEGSEYIIFWQEHNLPESLTNGKYHYEILVAEGSNKINESIAKVIKVDQPSYNFRDVKPNVIYSFAVRLVSDEGYQSPLSEVVSIRTSADELALPVAISTSNILSFAIPICLLIIALGSALTYFVVRHKKLSKSFTQFANSHYDTRRGQATFPGTADGLEEEDSPVIRGFSDDEPLVIA
ncbi:sortilin-related receptor [Nomia melanderi]|uniref:sortilin-related receptor n=1 Tax=Nomia melanderi TaxID=2448451 RepID=UPI003FCD289C